MFRRYREIRAVRLRRCSNQSDRIVDALGKSSASRRRIIERRECAATITEPARCSAIRIISYNIASVIDAVGISRRR
jgi:hypothetical protein